MLNSSISCKDYSGEQLSRGEDTSSTLRLPDGRVLEDKRTDAEILKEIYYLICGIVPTRYAEMVSEYIHRDATLKENNDGIWVTASKIRQAVKDFRKQRLSKEEEKTLDEIKEIKPSDPQSGEAFTGLCLNNFRSSPLPTLSCSLALGDEPTSRINCQIILDTGSSHPSVPYKILKRIRGFKDDDINRRTQYKLTTPSTTDNRSVILGSVSLALILVDDQGTEHQLALEALVLDTDLPVALLDVNFLRKHDYTIGIRNEKEQLKLRLNFKYKKKYFYFTTQRQSIDHSKSVFSNISRVRIGKDEKLIRMRGHALPGTYEAQVAGTRPVYLHLSEYNAGNFDVNIMMQSMGDEYHEFLPGELRLRCEPNPNIFDTNQVNNYIFPSSPSQSPEYRGQVPNRTRTHNNQDHGVNIMLGHSSSSGQEPVSGKFDLPEEDDLQRDPPSTKPPPPRRGDTRKVNSEGRYIQNLEPIPSDQFTEAEIQKMQEITLPTDELENLVFRRNGLFPGVDEVDDSEWPDFGQANPQEQEAMKRLIMKYRQAFSRDKYEIGAFKNFEADISTIEGKSVHEKERDHAPQVLREAQPLIDGLLKAKIVRYATPEETPRCWTSNFLIQLKPEAGGFRKNSKADKLVEREKRREQKRRGETTKESERESEKRYRYLLDFRNVNYLVTDGPTPVFSSLDNLHLRKSSKARYAINFDFCQSYFSIRLNKASQLKTGVWHNGKILLLERLPQGLRSSSTIQMMVLQIVFNKETLNKFKNQIDKNFDIKHFQDNLLSFSDDFLYLAASKEEVFSASEAIMFCLVHHGMKISFSKTAFFQQSYTFLGSLYDLTDRSIKLSKARTDAINNWPSPRSIAEIQSRLAQMSYFSSHLASFKIVGYPLYVLCREGTMQNFGLVHLETFQNLKFLFKLCITLTIPDPDFQLVLSSDASSIGLSACAMQLNPSSRRLEVISMLSRLFSKGALTRPILSKESLGVCWTLEKHSTLIQAAKHPVILITDSSVLQYGQNHRILSTPIQSFSLIMAAHRNVHIMHVPSAVNFCADLVSRTVTGGKPKKASKGERDCLEQLNTKILNPNNAPVRFSHKEIMQILNTPPDNSVSINPKKSFERADFLDSPISNLEQILFSPPEQVFFQLTSGKISETIRAHSLWQKIKNLKKTTRLTDLDIDKLRKKHKLDSFDLEVFKMMSSVESETEPQRPIIIKDRKEETPVSYMASVCPTQNLHLCGQVHCQHSESSENLLKNHATFLRKVKNSFSKNISGNIERESATGNIDTEPGARGMRQQLTMASMQPTSDQARSLDPVMSRVNRIDCEIQNADTSESESGSVQSEDDDEMIGYNNKAEETAMTEVKTLTSEAETLTSDQPSTDTVHMYPKTAERFIISMIHFLRVINQGNHKQLIKKLEKFETLDFKTRLILYTRAVKILKSHLKDDNNDNYSFCQIVPTHIAQDSDIRVLRGEDSLKLCLKKEITVKTGELKTFKYGVTLCILKHWCYIRASDKLLRNTLHDLPEIQSKPYPHISRSYIIPKKTIRFEKDECILEIKGFTQNRVTFERLEDSVSNTRCDHEKVKGQIYTKRNIIPVIVQNKVCVNMEKQSNTERSQHTEQVILALVDIYLQEARPTPTESAIKEKQGVLLTQQTTPGGGSLGGLALHSPGGRRAHQEHSDPLAGEVDARTIQAYDEIEDEIDAPGDISNHETFEDLRERHHQNNLTFLNTILTAKENETVSFVKYFLAHMDYRILYEKIQQTKPEDYVIKNNLIYKKVKTNLENDLRLVLPRHVSHLVARHIHSANGEHTKAKPLRILFERAFEQINRKENIFRIAVEGCGICLLNRSNYIKKQKMSKRTVKPLQAYETLVFDIASALPGEFTSCLIGACALSGFAMGIPLKTNTSEDMINAVKEIFKYYSTPSCIITDFAQYWGSTFTLFLNKHNVSHFKMNSKRSDECGAAERLICLARERLSRFCLSGDQELRRNWHKHLWVILNAYNNEPRTGTQISKTQLFLGPNFYTQRGDFFYPGSELVQKELEKVQSLRDNKKDINNRKTFKPGSLVVKIQPTKTASIHEESRYLVQNGEMYEVLDSCEHTTLLRSKSSGAVTTSLPNSLRLLTFKQYQETLPQKAINVFSENMTRKGSQPFFTTVYDLPDPSQLAEGAHKAHAEPVEHNYHGDGPVVDSHRGEHQHRQGAHQHLPVPRSSFRKTERKDKSKVTFSQQNQISAVIKDSHDILKVFNIPS